MSVHIVWYCFTCWNSKSQHLFRTCSLMDCKLNVNVDDTNHSQVKSCWKPSRTSLQSCAVMLKVSSPMCRAPLKMDYPMVSKLWIPCWRKQMTLMLTKGTGQEWPIMMHYATSIHQEPQVHVDIYLALQSQGRKKEIYININIYIYLTTYTTLIHLRCFVLHNVLWYWKQNNNKMSKVYEYMSR